MLPTMPIGQLHIQLQLLMRRDILLRDRLFKQKILLFFTLKIIKMTKLMSFKNLRLIRILLQAMSLLIQKLKKSGQTKKLKWKVSFQVVSN